MKYLAIILACFCMALTPAEKAIVEHVRQLNIRQKAELEDVRAKLVWTHKELEDKEPQLAQLSKERDEWKFKAEQSTEKAHKLQVSKLRWQFAFSGLAALAVAYLGIKFFTPIGRLI